MASHRENCCWFDRSHDLKNLYCFFFLAAFLAPPLLELCVAYRTCDAPTAAADGTRNLGIVGRAALVGVDRLSLASEARHCCVEAIVWVCGGGPVSTQGAATRRRRRRDGVSRIESSSRGRAGAGSPVSGSRRGQLARPPRKKVGPGADCGTALHRLGIGAAGTAFLSLLTAC